MKMLLKPKPPYNFELSLDFMMLKDGSGPFPERRIGNEVLRAFRINNKVIPARIIFVGNVDKPELKVITPNISSKEKIQLKSKISNWLNLDDDLSALYKFMEMDEKLRKIKEKLYGLRVPKMGVTVYETVVKCIIQQQISLRVAFNMISNLVKKLGESVSFEGEKYYEFPQPFRLSNTSVSKLRKCGLSSKKAEYIINFSKEVASKNFDPEEAVKWDENKISEEFKKFKGIGEWTVKMIGIAGLGIGQPPAEDLGIRKAISKYFFNEKTQSVETIRNFMSKWKGMKYLSVYLLYAYRVGLDV
jgi:DNA-3-methyladenine glycosylase II